MSIYMSERKIAVVAPDIYCDGCHGSLNLVEDLTKLQLSKVPESERKLCSIGCAGLFRVPGIPRTEKEAAVVAKQRGWKRESMHGKELDFCPACQAK